mmetsp:Transcript_100562/g.288118  ORF Transcript_100562/g.288118 Transcript_100562/m.288118 type:complete len:350 (-) Transcript_100562:1016-2065(-)
MGADKLLPDLTTANGNTDDIPGRPSLSARVVIMAAIADPQAHNPNPHGPRWYIAAKGAKGAKGARVVMPKADPSATTAEQLIVDIDAKSTQVRRDSGGAGAPAAGLASEQQRHPRHHFSNQIKVGLHVGGRPLRVKRDALLLEPLSRITQFRWSDSAKGWEAVEDQAWGAEVREQARESSPAEEIVCERLRSVHGTAAPRIFYISKDPHPQGRETSMGPLFVLEQTQVHILRRPAHLHADDRVFADNFLLAYHKLAHEESSIFRYFHDIDKKDGFSGVDGYLKAHAKVVQWGPSDQNGSGPQQMETHREGTLYYTNTSKSAGLRNLVDYFVVDQVPSTPAGPADRPTLT